jgi:hypothetical protein
MSAESLLRAALGSLLATFAPCGRCCKRTATWWDGSLGDGLRYWCDNCAAIEDPRQTRMRRVGAHNEIAQAERALRGEL